jgi:OmpA-OmpF porin, OOP family
MLNKKIIVGSCFAGILALGCAINANAAVDGPYLGVQAGWGDSHNSKGDLGLSGTDINVSGSDGLAGGVFAGYQFNRNFALELGYTHYHNTSVSNILPAGYGLNGNVSIKDQALDLVGKGIIPLANCFNLYGELGMAYLDEKVSANVSDGFASGTASESENAVLPTFGIGVSYDITPNVPVSLGWNRIQKVGNTDLTSKDLVSLGIAYNFGGN